MRFDESVDDHFFSMLVNMASDAIIAIDERQTIIFFSRGAERTFGYDASEVKGQPLAILLPSGAVEPHARHVEGFFAGSEPLRLMGERGMNLAGRRKDGTIFPAEVSIAKTVHEGQRLAMAILRDVSSLKETEKKLAAELAIQKGLRAIDSAIVSGLDVRDVLPHVLEQVRALLGADASRVMLLNPSSQVLARVCDLGFREASRWNLEYPFGEGLSGTAVLDHQAAAVTDPTRLSRGNDAPFPHEDFAVGYFAPLLVRGAVLGVLEVYFRTEMRADSAWMSLLETLAGQAAIAVDNAALLKDLQRSNANLILAYDATIEGWSRGLDLRDRETEGHTLRVTELAVRLAREYGLSEAEIVHVRRGALLHDIGKLGVPDGILHKQSSLSEDEWTVMRKHPQFAFEMLSPIAFLRPSLDIPGCHHEKWDGTGYPRGLKGEQIPLNARIFAIVDVWDALRSDRPYRASWPFEKVVEHIRNLSGTHFDPCIVPLFLKIIAEEQPS